MNTQEFKAWFAGYTEGKETLTAEQFKRVCDEVAKLGGSSDITPAHPWTPSIIPRYPVISDGIQWVGGDPPNPYSIPC